MDQLLKEVDASLSNLDNLPLVVKGLRSLAGNDLAKLLVEALNPVIIDRAGSYSAEHLAEYLEYCGQLKTGEIRPPLRSAVSSEESSNRIQETSLSRGSSSEISDSLSLPRNLSEARLWEEVPTELREDLSKNLLPVRLLCNWLPSEELVELWSKMSANGRGAWVLKGDSKEDPPRKWDGFQITSSEEAEVTVIINAPSPITATFDKQKTLVFQMEPHMKTKVSQWGSWSNPKGFCKVIGAPESRNNGEWHLSLTYQQLLGSQMKKGEKGNRLSAVLSGKRGDYYQARRLDFVRYLQQHSEQRDTKREDDKKGDEKKDAEKEEDKKEAERKEERTQEGVAVDLYGTAPEALEALPLYQKDRGLFPYKYHFACENHRIPNYVTEKLYDAILSECLCFYCGAPNVSDIIDPRAYIQVDLDSFINSAGIISEAIRNQEWEKRLPYIREAKLKILNELQFFPYLERLLHEAQLLPEAPTVKSN